MSQGQLESRSARNVEREILMFSRRGVGSELHVSGPYAGFSEGGFEMENLVTENELSLQVDPS